MQVYARDGGICTLCKSNKDITIDHIISVSNKGKSTFENLRLLCRSCNTKEGQKNRALDLMLEKRREYQRRFTERNPNYFTHKSREFRLRNKGYYRKINQTQHKLYMEAKI